MPGERAEHLIRGTIVPALALASSLLAALLLVAPEGLARRPARARGPAAAAVAAPPDAEGAAGAAPGPLLEATTPEEARNVVRYASAAGKNAVEDLRWMEGAADPLVAGNALRALGRLGAAPADGSIQDRLDDPRPRVRQEAVVALGLSRDPGAVAALEGVLDCGEPELKPLAVQALGRIGGARALSALERRLEDPAASEVERAFAREALEALTP
jgi:hypothetical protein